MFDDDPPLHHILLVEDDDEQRVIIGRILKDLQFKVTVMHNAFSASKFLEDHTVDIIISDWQMPETDGLAFYHQLQASDKYKKIPFILITACETEEAMEQESNFSIPRMICSKRLLGSQLQRQVKGILARKRKVSESEF
jgi:CheY-like chemotaxis protein